MRKFVEVLITIIIIFIIGLSFLVYKKGGFSTNINIVNVYGAISKGKEEVLEDEEINKVLKEKYNINFVSESWNNSDLINKKTIKGDGEKYDMLFFSDSWYSDYYKTSPKDNEAERFDVLDSEISLSTPMVLYSWDKVVDALIKEKIVTLKDNVYYVTNMKKLFNLIINDKKWSDIGLNITGSINIESTDPSISDLGASYYGLLASILSGGNINLIDLDKYLPELREYYLKSGYQNSTSENLFSVFLKTGMGDKAIIVDYEKSLLNFANSNPEGYNSIKDKIRVLYITPTIYKSQAIYSLTENGKLYSEVMKTEEVQNRIWTNYGYRVDTQKEYSSSISGIPTKLDDITNNMKMEVYKKIINYFK